MHRQLWLHPNCKKQQHAHLAETKAQVQTVRSWHLEELHDRLYLNDLEGMAKSIVLPKVQTSTYRLLLKLVKDGILKTEMTPLGSKVIYPDWTETWTWAGWDGDVSEVAGKAALARGEGKRRGRNKARSVARGRRRRRQASPQDDLKEDIESLGSEEASLAGAEDERSAAIHDFYTLTSGRASRYTSAIRRLARLDNKVQQYKAGIDDRICGFYGRLQQTMTAK